MSKSAIEGQCHCGNIRISLDALPDTFTSCNCSICHRLGALWAYTDTDKVSIDVREQPQVSYRWSDQKIAFYHCANCGCTTHFSSTENNEIKRFAINARMFDQALVSDIKIRKFDGAKSWQYLDE